MATRHSRDTVSSDAGAPDTKPAKRRVRRRKALKPLQEEEGSGTAANHTYDNYRQKWDKFDVDKALAEASHATSRGRTHLGIPTRAPLLQAEDDSEWEWVTEEEEEQEAAPSAAASASRTSAAAAQQAEAQQMQQAQQADMMRKENRVLPVQQPDPTTAEGWKDRGNDHFKRRAATDETG